MKKITPENGLPAKLSQPALRALHGAGYTTLAQLSKVSETSLNQLHGIGPNALVLIKAALADKGLSFAKEKK
jgi:DNA-directed RNA polymerase alpha subunit